MRNEPQRLNTVTTRTKEAMLNGLRLQMTADDYCDCGTTTVLSSGHYRLNFVTPITHRKT